MQPGGVSRADARGKGGFVRNIFANEFPRRALLAGLVATVCAAVVSSFAHSKTAQQKEVEEGAKRRPMAFFLAKGGADACGKGCSEWIAAEGVFDRESATRFETFLTTLKRDGLPVYFNSPGGYLGQSLSIARQLRKHRMTVGVGRTLPVECGRHVQSDACHRLMQSKAEHKARLAIDGARCSSACTYAFVGGIIRVVGKGAELRVHAASPMPGANDSPGGRAMIHDHVRRHLLEMGVDTGLVDLAASTKSPRMRVLTREDITRFSIETTK